MKLRVASEKWALIKPTEVLVNEKQKKQGEKRINVVLLILKRTWSPAMGRSDQ